MLNCVLIIMKLLMNKKEWDVIVVAQALHALTTSAPLGFVNFVCLLDCFTTMQTFRELNDPVTVAPISKTC